MKFLLILIFLVGNLHLTKAQQNKKIFEKHQKKIKNSLKNKSETVSLDTFFYIGKPISLYTTLEKGIFDDLKYELSTLKNNKPIIEIGRYLDPITNISFDWDIIFIETAQKIRISGSENPLELLAIYKVINDSSISNDGLKRLILAKSDPIINTSKPKVNPTNANNPITERPLGLILVIGNKVLQSNIHIGNITENTTIENNTIKNQIVINYINGTVCAIAKNTTLNSTNWLITTSKDNKINILEKLSMDIKSEIATYLISNLYL